MLGFKQLSGKEIHQNSETSTCDLEKYKWAIQNVLENPSEYIG